MSLVSRLVQWIFKLPPAETHHLEIERNIPIEMPDGVVLFGDHYYPHGTNKLPTILVRCPYGRGGMFGLLFARLFAERGLQVFIQSCRGTFDSGGEFVPFRNEKADGLATIAWLKQQKWFSGAFATLGPSYLGFVQWAVAAEAGPELKALSIQVSASEFHSLVYPGGSFGLDTSLTWVHLMMHQEEGTMAGMMSQARSQKALRPAFAQLPLQKADVLAVEKPVSFFHDWLEHSQPDDPWWDVVDFSGTLEQVAAPVCLLGGWYDIFLPQTIADYQRLKQAGKQPYLTIGPWTHTGFGGMAATVREGLIWLRAQLLNDRSGLGEKPVRIQIMGTNKWREYDEWPPAGYAAQRWYLQANHALDTAAPQNAAPDTYRYDPANPTPSVGGVSLSMNSGPKDNRKLEARADVLSYSSAVLDHDVEIIGDVQAELYVKSSIGYTDFFVRLCDVDAAGKSTNICDGLLRLSPGQLEPEEDGCLKISVNLWPTAHRFLKGHRVRLQVSSGAHPRFVRNPGSGEPLASATTLVTADQAVYHDPAHPSAVILPVRMA